MWIRTQNQQRMINSDQIVDIFVDNTGTKIMADIALEGGLFTLGAYDNRQICLDILDHIALVIGTNLHMLTLPLGGEVDKWKEGVASLATVYIAKSIK